ncbi:steroid receptor RNA activator 1 isoform X2 [Syngnathoides biaculeatus]|uniref:steroid receptor RNA activator 1 isoform X2 n=1 Tax=Syngnathoides biaculeatus TaxID=300417 RepID=UPI002ADE8366|nr:steroid receptor RNA activator 1 isoform X2 [Syngnathoides biaculeatus]
MEDMYVKPGNQERGWNDPPQFSYGLQTAHTPQRNLLNKRPAMPDAAAPFKTPHPCASGPLPCGVAPPPAGRAPEWKVTPPAAGAGEKRIEGDEDCGQLEAEPDVEGVEEILEGALAACRRDVAPQVCNDVEKRLRLFKDSWTSGRLSLAVRKRMSALSREMQAGRWDQADEIHRSLMVDHVTEVSQWMVGVKRLIAETRKLCPETLDSGDACQS